MSIVFALISAMFLTASFYTDEINEDIADSLRSFFRGIGFSFFFFVCAAEAHKISFYIIGFVCLFMTALAAYFEFSD